MKRELKFILSFLIISSVIYIFVSIFYSKDFPLIGTKDVTLIANKVLNFIGIRTIVLNYDKIYFSNNTVLEIILECTGIYEMIILSSIILSYPTNIKNKFVGIILGIMIIYILNMIRLISIAYILIYHTDKFNFVDRYLWQISLVIFISLAYMIWLKSIERPNITGNVGRGL